MFYTVNKAAKMTGVTLRTLRYYDSIGLLHPESRSETGYRLYSDGDMELLRQILLLKEMDFPLEKIAEIVTSPEYKRRLALEAQAEYLEKCAERYLKLAQLARAALGSAEGEKVMSNEDFFMDFNTESIGEIQEQYEDEVKRRWGQTDAYRVSTQRAAKYSKEDWDGIIRLQNGNLHELAECFRAGLPADSERVQNAVESARKLIDVYFYPCSPEMMGNLGDMYVSDPRFKKHYDKVAEGLAEYYNEAIRIYCRRA